MANYHVTRVQGTNDWRVKREHARKAARIAPSQAKAEKIAKEMAHNSGGGEVRIHSRSGQIRDSDTVKPGRDPNPPKDKVH
ncbi:MAG: DUF2188 domain-containing protein [Blastocatellia bacterium]|nr:DUF2188 domain-containing protein [Blastocatellia bacterium]